jgi:branched-chain amino acid transport system permease protein
MSGLKRVSGSLKALGVVTVIFAIVGLVILDQYWQYVASIGAAEAVLGLSIGIVYGQAGMLVLSQVALSVIGAWTVAYLTGTKGWLPLPWSLFVGAIISVPIGVLVGMPALRLRRVNLAIITVGFIVVIEAVSGAGQVPGSSLDLYVEPPSWGLSGYGGLFVLCWASFVVLAALTIILRRARWGLSWLAIARSERAAAAMGVSVTRAKVTAFAVAALIAGWAGGLIVASYGLADPSNFNLMTSLTLFALAVMMGAGYWEGALALGVFNALSSALLRQWNISPDFGTLLFAVGAIQVLGAENGGFSGQIRRGIAKFFSHPPEAQEGELLVFDARRTEIPAAPAADGPPALEISGLHVSYGAVKALQDVSFSVRRGEIVGLVGPNGSGKSTLVDATTGFLPFYQGSIRVGGDPIDALAAFKRARLVRRTFQQDRTIGELTPEDYLRLSAAPGTPRERIQEVLDFLGCTISVPMQSVDARMRRLLMIGACLVGSPAAILIDEPAAGLSMEESIDLAARLVEIPRRFDCGVVLIEHDMELVRLVCPTLVVLDFGRVIATGPTQAVLSDPQVTSAYLGEDIAAEHVLAEEARELAVVTAETPLTTKTTGGKV